MSSSISEPRGRKRVGIIQSSYIPWKGYFDFIDSVDAFVLLDEVQYTRRDWRNRNKIKTQHGASWLTIPVETKGNYHDPIDAIRISDDAWLDDHLTKLQHSYARAPHFREVFPWVKALFETLRGELSLSKVNEALLRAICERLGIRTAIYRSREFETVDGKNERLISICNQLEATDYLSGPAARGYIDEDVWRAHGVSVAFKSYVGYPPYEQIHPPFEHGVTILDLLLNCGDEAQSLMKSATDVEA